MEAERYSPIDHLTAQAVGQEVGRELSASFREGKLCLRAPVGIMPSEHIVIEGEYAYLTRAWNMLQESRAHIERLSRAKPEVTIEMPLALFEDQKEAIRHALQNQIFCIWGGPGTGKTYTARIFYELYVKGVDHHKKIRVALTAPTGKASLHLAKSFQGVAADVKTLHALLNLKPSLQIRQEEELLPYDLLIIDESSMIDGALFNKLLRRLADGTKVLFLGDPDQLPPVEPGTPFQMLVERQEGKGRLISSRRTDVQPILDLASLVLQGDAAKALRYLKEGHTGITFKNIEEASFSEYVKRLDTLQFLSPLKVGPFGADEVNRRLHAYAVKQGRKGEPIVITKNDHQLGLSNGDIGKVEGEMVFFPISGRHIPKILLSSYEHAYCLSVHKSQGSEFDAVAILLPPGSERFGKKMLYTAITRAKRAVEVWSTEEVLRGVVERE